MPRKTGASLADDDLIVRKKSKSASTNNARGRLYYLNETHPTRTVSVSSEAYGAYPQGTEFNHFSDIWVTFQCPTDCSKMNCTWRGIEHVNG